LHIALFLLLLTLEQVVLHGGDVFLRLMTLWMMFMPVEKCWSVDKVTPCTYAKAHIHNFARER
jgi:hypothetical protein